MRSIHTTRYCEVSGNKALEHNMEVLSEGRREAIERLLASDRFLLITADIPKDSRGFMVNVSMSNLIDSLGLLRSASDYLDEQFSMGYSRDNGTEEEDIGE